MSTSSASATEPDIYASSLGNHQLAYDAEDYRRSLYTNVKADHPANDLTGEPCDCEGGDTRWERNGIAMGVHWPPQPRHEATESARQAEPEAEAG